MVKDQGSLWEDNLGEKGFSYFNNVNNLVTKQVIESGQHTISFKLLSATQPTLICVLFLAI